MKQIYSVLMPSLILFCGSGFAQSAPQPQLPPGARLLTPTPAPVTAAPLAPANFTAGQKFRYYSVQWYMTQPSPLKLGDQLLAGMGDEAAADILLTIGSSSNLATGQMRTAMDIIHKSFVHPRAIQNRTSRKPTASLAILQRIQATALDEQVKERVAAEISYVEAVPQTLPPLTLPANLGLPPTHTPIK